MHLLIERDRERRFILTGSSARKLKRGSANLLAGRALVAHMNPLVSAEVGTDRLEDRLLRGSLPQVRRIVACGEKWRRITSDGIEILPIRESLRELWNDSLLASAADDSSTAPRLDNSAHR